MKRQMNQYNKQNRNWATKIMMVLIMMSMVLSACGKSDETADEIEAKGMFQDEIEGVKVTELDEEVDNNSVTAINQLGIELLQELSQKDSEANIIFSPTSLAFALAMVQNGATGVTQDEILAVLEEEEDGINQRYNILMNYLNSLEGDDDMNPGIKMIIGNSLWVKEGIEPKQDFVEQLNTYYNAKVFVEDFSDVKTIDKMNQWVEEQSNHILKETITSLDEETIALLMNTVYFKGVWSHEFNDNKTTKDNFYVSDETTRSVDMMHQVEFFSYYEDTDVQMVNLPYYDGCSMVVVLPKKDVDEFVEELDMSRLQQMIDPEYNVFIDTRIDLSLPKLDYKNSHNLNELLIEQGMVKAFDPNEAEFANLIDVENENVYISEIFQNARIIVGEVGTEAAAVTVIDVKATGAEIEPSDPVEFKCDHPYMYIIKDHSTGTVLFVGLVREP